MWAWAAIVSPESSRVSLYVIDRGVCFFSWRAAHASITYWLLDAHPAPTDGARRAVEWVGVAEAAAGHVGAGEVDERLTIVC